MAELNLKFRYLLDRGINGLPNHARSNMFSRMSADMNEMFDVMNKAVSKQLVNNYNFPEGSTESYSEFRHAVMLSSGLPDHNYGPFHFMGGFLHSIFSDWVDHSNLRCFHLKVDTLVRCSKINESIGSGNEGMVSRIANFKSLNKNGEYKTTRARFARTINQMFPGLPEVVVDAMNDVWKDSYGTFNFDNYHIHVGRTDQHFLAAYENTNVGTTSNIETTIFTKHLSNSCMQYERDDEDGWEDLHRNSGIHCVTAYATEDSDFEGLESKRFFEVMYVTDNEDPFEAEAQVYGRVIFSRIPETGFPELGPMYVTSNMIKQYMVEHVPTLVEENIREDFKEYFSGFLRDTDSKNCYDFPYVWEGAILKAFDQRGCDLKTETYIANSKYEENTAVISPYLDIGKKAARPTFNKSNGCVYLQVSNLMDAEMEGYQEQYNHVFNETLNLGVNVRAFINHQGVNWLAPLNLPQQCECCEEVAFGLTTVIDYDNSTANICPSCRDKDYKYSGVDAMWYRADEVITGSLIHRVGVPYGYGWKVSVLNDLCSVSGNGIDLSINRNEYYAPFLETEEDCFSVRRNMTMRNNLSRFEIIEDVNVLSGLYTNVHLARENLVEVNGRYYFKYDTRVCWDMINNKLCVDESPHIITFTKDYEDINLKVSLESYLYIKMYCSFRSRYRDTRHSINIVDLTHVLKELSENRSTTELEAS